MKQNFSFKYPIFCLMLLMLCACQEDDVVTVNMRVNHFKQAAIGAHPVLVFQVQEGADLGTEYWQYEYGNIVGFNYEWGFVYDLAVNKKTLESPPPDGSSIELTLRQVVSQTPIGQGETFEIRLKSAERGIEGLVHPESDQQYLLGWEQTIDCLDLCDQLEQWLDSQDEITGVFRHSTTGTLQLLELKNQ